jgi:tetratricopeptide (TPR) repeat protein
VPFILPAFALLLAGCVTQQVSDNQANNTLGALANSQIDVQQEKIENPNVQSAMESYRRAANLFDNPEQRNQSIQRMAAIAMQHAEKVPGSETTQHPTTTKPGASAEEKPAVTEEKLDQDIDKRLYDIYMKGAINASNNAQRKNMLGMANRVATRLNDIDLKGDYQTAIKLYLLLLQSSTDPEERADTYYRLARAYAMAGDLNKELDALTDLTKQYPDSAYYVEAQFRRGEMLFADSEFDTAALAYQAVVKAGPGSFYEQSLYKLGWSNYKLGSYNQALGNFFDLLHVLGNDQKDLANKKSMQAKLYQDTTRVISLAFSNQDGSKSLQQWFASHQQDRPYEKEIYRALGSVYLHQERYRDAADTYAMFVKEHPADIDAPEFSTLEIKAFEDGHFPSLVLPAKQAFVEQYGIHSSFWKAHPKKRADYAPQLKEHLLDLATYYHAQAQKSGKIEDYQKPIRWYKEYLDTPPVSKQQAEINLRYAAVLYAAQDYANAVEQFEYTAYHYPKFAKANEAGYGALLAYQSELDTLEKTRKEQSGDKAADTAKTIAALRKNKIASSLKFAKTFNSDPHVPAVFKSVAEDQLAENNVVAAVETAGFLVNRKPTPSNDYLRYGWSTIANGEYDLKRYKVSEVAYKQLLAIPGLTAKEQHTYQNKMAMAVYQQAADLERAGKIKEAAAGFLRVDAVYPQATIRKEADFTAAALYLKLKDYKTAIPILTDFKTRYPQDKLVATIPAKLAVAYENTGDYASAAAQLEAISDRDAKTDKEMARQALWKAAEMQDRAKDANASIRLYEKYVGLYPTPYNFQAEARFRLLNFYKTTGNSAAETHQLHALVDIWKAAGSKADARITWLAAMASFQLAEPLYQHFAAIKLTLPLKRSLAEKSTAMKQALKAYEAVGDMKVADFTPAANYRIASLYQNLSQDILASEHPNGMSKLEDMQYGMLLENQAMPYSDKAIDIYKNTANLAHQGIYNKWVKQSFDALAKLVPGRYAKFEKVETYVDIIY